MHLSLSEMLVSESCIRPPTEIDIPLLTEWFRNYAVDSGMTNLDNPRLNEEASTRAHQTTNYSNLRLLLENGRPVAMSGINARALGFVQVGSVFTPRALRGSGYGASAVAAQLMELRAGGMNDAILFAASEPAERCYRKIGFEPIGSYRLVMAKSPIQIGPEHLAKTT
jgi:predicted GNAT family acetyltransferase